MRGLIEEVARWVIVQENSPRVSKGSIREIITLEVIAGTSLSCGHH